MRISHAKDHGLLKGELKIDADLPLEFAPELFAKPGTFSVLVRLAAASGEPLDDS